MDTGSSGFTVVCASHVEQSEQNSAVVIYIGFVGGGSADLLVQLLLRSASKVEAVMLDKAAQSLIQSNSEFLKVQQYLNLPRSLI